MTNLYRDEMEDSFAVKVAKTTKLTVTSLFFAFVFAFLLLVLTSVV